jgi:uncharacterized protein YfiM (DUF2279 family)
MTIAPEMKELTRNIASSHQDRMKRIGEIREEVKGTRIETQDMIHSFEDSRQETSRQMRKDLARDKTGRTSEVKGILREAQNTLKGFKTSRKRASAQLIKDLSGGEAERKSEVIKMLEGTHELIKGFRTSRQNGSNELRKDLSRSRARARSEVGKLLGSARSLIKDLQVSRKEVGNQLRRDLAQSTANVASDVKQMQDVFRKAQEDVRADLQEARAAWQGLASTMPADRGGVKTPHKAKAPAAQEETPDLETRLLTAIDECPAGGMTLADLANTLGVAPVVLGKASRNLLEKGKIRKKNKLYFPADGEKAADIRFRFRRNVR